MSSALTVVVDLRPIAEVLAGFEIAEFRFRQGVAVASEGKRSVTVTIEGLRGLATLHREPVRVRVRSIVQAVRSARRTNGRIRLVSSNGIVSLEIFDSDGAVEVIACAFPVGSKEERNAVDGISSKMAL